MSETESLMLRILERIQADLADVKAELADLKADVKSELDELGHDMDAGFAALRQQGDRRFLSHEGRIRTLEQDSREMKAELRLEFRAMRTGFASIGSRLDGIEERLPKKR